jgi:hypothetical protein
VHKNIAIETFAIPLFLAFFVLGSAVTGYVGYTQYGISGGTGMVGFALLAVIVIAAFRAKLY